MRKLRTIEIDRLSVDGFRHASKLPLIVVLDDVRSLYNVGSIFRTCDAFRVQGIYLCGITATPPHNEIHKTALGAEDSVAWQYFEKAEDAVNHLREQGFRVYAAEQAEGSLLLCGDEGSSLSLPYPCALVLGNEVKGVSQDVIDVCDGCIEIPQFGTKHSMNVAVAAGVLIWEIAKPYLNNLGIKHDNN